MDALTKVRNDLDAALEEAEAFTTREGFDPSDPGYTALKSTAETLQRSYSAMAEWRTRKSESDKIGAALHKISGEREEQTKTRSDESLSLGEMFTRSDAFKGYAGHGSSSRVEIDQPLRTRAAISTLVDPGKAFMEADKSFSGKAIPRYQAPLLGLANAIQVSSGTVEWVEYPAAAPLAAIVAEGALKPEAVLTASTVSKSLENVAHHVVVTRQALEDSAQLRSWIDGNLVRGVGDKLESLAATALTSATLPTANGADLLSGIRNAIAQVQMAGYRPNAIAINPADAAEIDIAIMSGTLGGAAVNGSVWGIQIVPVGAVPVGGPIVGNFTDGLTFFYRTGTQLLITDSHADFFLRNQFVILAERRALSVVTTPEALCEVTTITTRTASAAK